MNVHRTVRNILLLSLLLTLMVGGSLISAQEGSSLTPEQEEAERTLLETVVNDALEPGEFDSIAQWVHEDYVVHTPLGDMDRDGLVGFFQALHASLSDFTMTRESIIVEGNAAATRITISGTFDKADFPTPMGMIPPNGQQIVLSAHTYHVFADDGRVLEEWAMYDVLGFLTQLGALPAPSS